MAAHSPTPWTSGSSAIFAGKKCIGVTDCDSSTPNVERANAAFIVRAVNAHDDLVAALKAAKSELEAYEQAATGETYNSTQINAALAKAEAL